MQQVIPDKKKFVIPEVITRDLRIHPEAPKAVADDVQGRYNLNSGDIFLSTFEKTTPRVLWHEQIHKLLFESDIIPHEEALKTTIQWDKIANDLEEFLFPNEKMPKFEVNYGTAIQNSDVYKKYIKKSFR